MRRIVVISALAFVIAGCASQQGGGPQVRDLSQARQAVEMYRHRFYTKLTMNARFPCPWPEAQN